MASPRTERRLAAILAADIVGYSRLVERDEAGTLAAIKALRERVIDPLVAEHHGRIVKLMGDGAIVEFGSVVDAVACAVAIQQRVAEQQDNTPPERRIVFRIGINLGDVVVEGEDLLGDGVNVAARLEQLCEPGGVLVSGTAYDQLQGKLGLPLEFTGEQRVKNIERLVRTYRVMLDGEAKRRVSIGRVSRAGIMAGAVALLAAGVFAGGFWWLRSPEPTSARPSIAVLRFESEGSDNSAARLADGITNDLITDLARFRDLDVIAGQSPDAYRDKTVDVRRVGADLGVGNVLTGSIQRQAAQVRITAKLISTADGKVIWTNRWDRPDRDLFTVQSEVAQQVVNVLGSAHGVLEQQALAAIKRRSATDLVAYDLAQLAAEANGQSDRANLERGLAYADEAIARDPTYAQAYVIKGWLLFNLAKASDESAIPWAELETIFRNAVALDPFSAWAHASLGFAISANKEAKPAFERAIELAPSSADILNTAADRMPFFGEPELGAELCDRSFHLNPLAPRWYYPNCFTAYFYVQRHKDVVEFCDQYRSGGYTLNQFNLVWCAASHMELGDHAGAKALVTELKRQFPTASIEYFLQGDWTFDRQREEDQILVSARHAGIRICATADELTAFPSPRHLPDCDAERSQRHPTTP